LIGWIVVIAAGMPSTTLASSPYEAEVSRLRLEQLRLDEEHLLERKRQHELERIRGPQPKWSAHHTYLCGGYNDESTSIQRAFDECSTAYQMSLRSQ